jgi:hypothetical protein
MADERDPQVSRRYRELGAEEPPRALDDAILAASRKAVRRRGWYGPVAIAAVLTLAVAVTVQLERQKPEELVASAPPPPLKEGAVLQEEKRQAFKAPEQPKPAAKPFTPEPPRAATAPQSAEAVRDLAKSNEQASAATGARADQAPASPPVVAQAAPPPEPARREMEAPRSRAGASAEGKVAAQMQRKAETPEASLQRIAELRKQGRHEEADKALEEFRKRYPDYRLSDEMKAKVEKK